jgi:chromosome segregation ATPase
MTDLDQDVETVRDAARFYDKHETFGLDTRDALDRILARITELEVERDALLQQKQPGYVFIRKEEWGRLYMARERLLQTVARITELERISAPDDFDFEVYLIKRIQEVEAPLQARITELEAEVERLRAQFERCQAFAKVERAEVERLRARITELEEGLRRYLAAFDERFKPMGMEDEYAALRALLGEK